MPRNELEDALRAIITGGMQGYGQSQQTLLDVKKDIWKERLKANMQKELMSSMMPQGTTSEDVEMSLTPSGPSYKFLSPYEKKTRILNVQEAEKKAFEATPAGEQEKAIREKKGLSIETGGKLAMVKQAKLDIQEVRDMLFPDKTPKSFKRGLAFASNLPASRFPVLGAVIPQALPFHEKGQKIYSRLQNAVAAKLRVETGAQANPSEVENILARFGVTSFSDPKAAMDALNRLENFMDETINITDPRGLYSKDPVVNRAVRDIVDRNDLDTKI